MNERLAFGCIEPYGPDGAVLHDRLDDERPILMEADGMPPHVMRRGACEIREAADGRTWPTVTSLINSPAPKEVGTETGTGTETRT